MPWDLTDAHPNLQATSSGVWPKVLRMLTKTTIARAAPFAFRLLSRYERADAKMSLHSSVWPLTADHTSQCHLTGCHTLARDTGYHSLLSKEQGLTYGDVQG